MVSIIVFSKDRPMQLHAYLESLQRHSCIKQKDISVLYYETPAISYSKIKKEFPHVNWKLETIFNKQLIELVKDANEYIMFGCDDVVFTGKMDLAASTNLLKENENIFGVSMMLGSNIKPSPKETNIIKNFIVWDWINCKETHYNYPWALCGTIYRKSDVLELLSTKIDEMTNPNYLESVIANSPQEYINRYSLACARGRGKAVCIPVNLVQDTHPNWIDDTLPTDVKTLSYMYNTLGNTLDIFQISKRHTNDILVDSSFLILKNNDPIKRIRSKIYIELKKIYLNGNGFSKKLNAIQTIFKRLYTITQSLFKLKRINILDSDKTLDLLINEPKSFCRLGDGELTIMQGRSIPFQRYNKKLAQQLKDILEYKVPDMYVGVPYFYFESMKKMNPYIKKFIKNECTKYKKQLIDSADMNKTYIDTGFTQTYQTYYDYDFNSYFNKVEELFKDKELIVVCGKNILHNLEYNIFNKAKNVEYIFGPSRNAYKDIGEIINQVKTEDKGKIVCSILGPASKVLVCELTKLGYIAWDIGHLAKDYDSFRRKAARTEQEIIKFYKPD
ncbi:MAG: hypothetical protein K0S61_2034 [Anaerocolumna sp.]|jgi:glycosyltransferase family protein|nr:hypothetical protein [Anaerocolumna sp.]